MTIKIYSPANYIKHWAQEKPDACFMQQPRGNRWVETSWLEAFQLVSKLASYLGKYSPNTKIAIYAPNCSDWFLVDMAIMAAGHISVPIYTSANGKTIDQILSHCGAELVFVGHFPKSDEYTDFDSSIELVAIDRPRKNMPYWKTLIEPLSPIESFFQPDEKDIATIVYTSGTTGMPKGVVISYRAITGGVECVRSIIHVDGDDRFVSYLPLAHILERIAVEIFSIVHGSQVGFVENLSRFKNNVNHIKPTIFIAVPRIWTKFKQAIEAKFGGARRTQRVLSLPIIGRWLKNKTIKGLGLDKMRYCLTGAAAISTDTLYWFEALGLDICEGYGLSETMGISNLNTPANRIIGTVGKPVNGCEVMLAENGEILLRSPCLMDGYYKEPELSAMAIQDGWFRTGDLGSVNSEGFLTIKGRVKEIFKTSKGKYVSPVPIEQKMEALFSVEQVCVFGSQLPQPIAVLVDPNTESIERQRFSKDIEKKLEVLNTGLEKHEKLAAVIVSTEDWTTENEMMTPTLKIRRQQIEDRFLSCYVSNPSEDRMVIFV